MQQYEDSQMMKVKPGVLPNLAAAAAPGGNFQSCQDTAVVSRDFEHELNVRLSCSALRSSSLGVP